MFRQDSQTLFRLRRTIFSIVFLFIPNMDIERVLKIVYKKDH